jgi:hypothetical protein
MHAGMAGGAVILLEGDDYTGRCVNLVCGSQRLQRQREIPLHARARGFARTTRRLRRRG